MMKLSLLYIMFSFVNLFSVTYYVSTNGDDDNNGRSRDEAFRTLQHAADIVVASDSVLTLNGDYAGFYLEKNGTEQRPIVFRGFSDNARITTRNPVTPDGINVENSSWVIIENFKVIGMPRNGIRVAVSSHVTIRSNYCDNNYERGIFTGFADYALIEYNECLNSQDEHGIYFSNSADHPIIRCNISHHNNGCGIHMNGDVSQGGDGVISDAIVEGNIIYENGNGGGSGINCDGVINSHIFNNLLYMNHASGISLYQIDASQGSHHVKIFNNTIIQPDNGRWCININTSSTNDTVYNNILINLHSYRGSITIDESSRSGFFSDYNLVVDRMSYDGDNVIDLSRWQSYGYDRHSYIAENMNNIFMDWQNRNFHYRENSQPVEKGTDAVSYIVKNDLDGVKRPQGQYYDIGCYEYVSNGFNYALSSVPSHLKQKIYFSNGYLHYRNLSMNDKLLLYNLSGRKISSFRINQTDGKLYIGNLPNGIILYRLISTISCKNISGKIPVIK
ncbi:MAG: right-handed parallel beta-helix repeat-containing protein [Candidatus Coatesbacteria bacterium]|nr:right-handed parallel beta-helix repeat-containing protein [Candidatus Coatesbacteria bacterium]